MAAWCSTAPRTSCARINPFARSGWRCDDRPAHGDAGGGADRSHADRAVPASRPAGCRGAGVRPAVPQGTLESHLSPPGGRAGGRAAAAALRRQSEERARHEARVRHPLRAERRVSARAQADRLLRGRVAHWRAVLPDGARARGDPARSRAASRDYLRAGAAERDLHRARRQSRRPARGRRERNPLSNIGRPRGYVARQVTGWTERYFNAKTDEISGVEAAAEWLARNMPVESGAAVIHNDYKYDNVMLDPSDLTGIVAVLDWEMATVGDPLMDLGTFIGYWGDPGDPQELRTRSYGPTYLPGSLSRSQIVERYAERSGRAVES